MPAGSFCCGPRSPCAMATDVELAMVDGRILLEDRKVVGLDEAALPNEAQAAEPGP